MSFRGKCFYYNVRNVAPDVRHCDSDEPTSKNSDVHGGANENKSSGSSARDSNAESGGRTVGASLNSFGSMHENFQIRYESDSFGYDGLVSAPCMPT